MNNIVMAYTIQTNKFQTKPFITLAVLRRNV